MVWIGLHRDAGRFQVDQQHADAGVARLGFGIGAHQREHPVGEVAVGGPHLVAVDDEVVAVELGARGQAREVGAGAGLRIALAPGHLAGEDRRQVLRLLLRRAGIDDQRPDEIEAVRIGRGRADAADLLEQDDLLRERRAHAAVLPRPMRRDPAALVELAVPGLELGRVDAGRAVAQLHRQIVGDPVAHLLAERAVGGSRRRRTAWCCPSSRGPQGRKPVAEHDVVAPDRTALERDALALPPTSRYGWSRRETPACENRASMLASRSGR